MKPTPSNKVSARTVPLFRERSGPYVALTFSSSPPSTCPPDFCASSIVWGTRSICRAQGEGGCTYVNTTAPCGTIQPTSPSPGPLTAAPTSSPTSSSELMVQCGVPLPPSISDWPVGTCGKRTSADPRVFGPPTWRTLHIFAEHYPVQPLPDVQRGCVNFINALPFLLPCPYSGYGFSQVSGWSD